MSAFARWQTRIAAFVVVLMILSTFYFRDHQPLTHEDPMPKYDIVAIERYEQFSYYYGVEANTPNDAITRCKGELAADHQKHCDYGGYVETQSVHNSETDEVCEF